MPKKQPIKFSEFDKSVQNIIREVADIMGIFEYEKIFASYQDKYKKAKYVCYQILYDRGLSYPQIGRKFKKDHTSILHGVRIMRTMPECLVVANIINERLKRLDNEQLLVDKFHDNEEKRKIYQSIKDCINLGYSVEKIAVCLNMEHHTVAEIAEVIVKTAPVKLVPDYKNNVVKKIYI